jgi:hypothetical protein
VAVGEPAAGSPPKKTIVLCNRAMRFSGGARSVPAETSKPKMHVSNFLDELVFFVFVGMFNSYIVVLLCGGVYV